MKGVKRKRCDEFADMHEINEFKIDSNIINYVSPSFSVSNVDTYSPLKFATTYVQDFTDCDICFYDCCPFEGQVYGLPVKWNTKDDSFQLWGRFCSLECTRAFVLDSNRKTRDKELELLALIGRKMYGVHTRIDRAPSKYLLSKFGGPLEIDDWRSELKTNRLWIVQHLNIGRTGLTYDIYKNNNMFMFYEEELKNRREPKKRTKSQSNWYKYRQKKESPWAPIFKLRRRHVPAYLPKQSILTMLGEVRPND